MAESKTGGTGSRSKKSDPVDSIREWAESDPRIDIGDDGAMAVAGDPPIPFDANADAERVLLTWSHDVTGAGAAVADAAVAAIGTRGSLVEGSASVTTAGVAVNVQSPIYVDGLSRDSFARAVQDLAAGVDRVLTAIGGGTPAPEPQPEPAEAEPEPARTEPEPEKAADPAPADPEPTPVFTATHQVPAGGMKAWATPDPGQEPVADLAARVQLTIAETRGAWAKVVGENGWTGWVDARRLDAAGKSVGSTAKPARTGAGSRSTVQFGELDVALLPLIGAAALFIATFLAWVDVGGTINALDVGIAFLWDFTAAPDAPFLGWATLLVGGLGAAVAILPGLETRHARTLGIIGIVLAGVFIGQLVRGVTDGGGEIGDVFDFIGIGPYVALGGSVVMMVGGRRA